MNAELDPDESQGADKFVGKTRGQKSFITDERLPMKSKMIQ